MTAIDFRAWQTYMGWHKAEASRQLGITRGTLYRYRASGAPLHIGLATAALAHHLSPWTRKV
jgi:hypothetical protein